MENISDPRSRNNNWIKVLSLGTAACMMIGGLFWWNRYRALNYTVEMDVNPSIELRVNKAEKVISAEALNKDAQIILEDMKLKGVDVDVATNAIIGSMVKNGYLSELSNSILLTVESDDHQKSVEVTDRLTNDDQRRSGQLRRLCDRPAGGFGQRPAEYGRRLRHLRGQGCPDPQYPQRAAHAQG